jgi:hypothetical protein
MKKVKNSQVNLKKELELVNAVLKQNAQLLDSLYRMTFCEIDAAQSDLLTNQLNKTGDYIIVYLTRIAKCVRKYKDQKK